MTVNPSAAPARPNRRIRRCQAQRLPLPRTRVHDRVKQPHQLPRDLRKQVAADGYQPISRRTEHEPPTAQCLIFTRCRAVFIEVIRPQPSQVTEIVGAQRWQRLAINLRPAGSIGERRICCR